MSLRDQHQHRGVQRAPAARRAPQYACSASRWRSSRPACASTAPPTTPPASRSPRRCAPRSTARRRPAATRMDGISLVQTAEGALNEMHSILQRVRELAVQYANGTLSTADQAAITAEIAPADRRARRISRQPSSTASTCSRRRHVVTLQVGANADVDSANNTNRVGITSISFASIGGRRGADVISDRHCDHQRRRTSAPPSVPLQNRLEHTVANLGVYQENLSAAESRIRDVDVAAGDGELHEAPDPLPVRHRHARAGQPAAPERAEAAAVTRRLRTSRDPRQHCIWRRSRSHDGIGFTVRDDDRQRLPQRYPPLEALTTSSHRPPSPSGTAAGRRCATRPGVGRTSRESTVRPRTRAARAPMSTGGDARRRGRRRERRRRGGVPHADACPRPRYAACRYAKNPATQPSTTWITPNRCESLSP